MRWTGCAIGATVLVLAAGCVPASDRSTATPAPGGGVSAPPAPPTRSPLTVNVEAALKIANREFDQLTAGNWAGAWQLWTDSAKKQVPRDVFVSVNTACPAPLRRTYLLQDVKPISN